MTGVRMHLCRCVGHDCGETLVFTWDSSFLIANSSIDDLARLCDDALGGGIRDQKHEKQKDDEQTRFDVQEARIAA